VGPEAVFADEDYVSGVVDYFGEVGVVGWVAVEIEDYVYADDRRFGGGDFGDELGEERSGDREGVVIADGGFIEVDVDDAIGGRLGMLSGDQEIVGGEVEVVEGVEVFDGEGDCCEEES